MQKFFVETNQMKENKIEIIGSDVKHITNVLRMQRHEKIQVCNQETAKNYIVEIEEIQKEKIITNILEELQTNTESNVKIDLYQGLPKADKMEFIIQKTTEIGIHSIIPVDMERCVVKLEEKEVKKKIERWQKIALAAAKQSKRDKIPQVKDKMKLKEVISKLQEYDKFLIAYEEELEHTLKQELQNMEKKENYKIGILIGPEGGIDRKEIELLYANGAIVITLGKRILRTETAPIVMTSNILYELENKKEEVR